MKTKPVADRRVVSLLGCAMVTLPSPVARWPSSLAGDTEHQPGFLVPFALTESCQWLQAEVPDCKGKKLKNKPSYGLCCILICCCRPRSRRGWLVPLLSQERQAGCGQ